MQKMSFKDVNPSLKDFYNRALDGQRRDDLDYAISTMKAVVQKAPGFIEARKKLREMELEKFDKVGGPGIGVALKNMRFSGKIRKMIPENPTRALTACEDMLALCVNNPTMLKLLAEAGEAAEAPFIVMEALELLIKFNPRAQDQIERLSELYRKEGQLDDTVKLFQALALQFPNDFDIQSKLRDATREAGRAKGKQNDTSERESLTLQLEDSILRDPGQARIMIEKYNAMLKENDSIDIRRKLASAYMVAGDYDMAAQALERVAKTLGSLDPQLDKLIEKAYLAKFDHNIRLLQSNPQAYENSEQQIAEYQTAREAFRLDRAQRRLAAYPRDAQLQLDLGNLHFERGEYDAAMVQFNEASNNSQRRVQARVGIGRIMMTQRNWTEAIRVFSEALGEMIRADRFKLDVMYDLARCYEAVGELPRALETFKEILQNNVKYRDVKQQIERIESA